MNALAWIKRRPQWTAGATALTTRWLESTLEVARWENMRRAGRRWGMWGGAIGLALGVLTCAPAGWLALVLNSASQGHVILADARGTLWNGDAVLVLSAGSGSRDATVLPGRLDWRLSAGLSGARLVLHQDCCMPHAVALIIKPGWGGTRLRVASAEPGEATNLELGQWPAALLGGLGTPWNTLQLGGVLHMAAQDLEILMAQGRLRVQGRAQVELDHVSSSLTPLDEMGSYQLQLQGDPQGQLQLTLQTLDGALQISGDGALTPTGWRFRGGAQSADPTSPALDNVLNIIGRREGVRSAISIG